MWEDALSVSSINNHAFLTVGVDKMDYLGDFSLRRSQIVEGRDFSQEEINNGSRVCILHDAVALASGISIGDTITLNAYLYVKSIIPQISIWTGDNIQIGTLENLFI